MVCSKCEKKLAKLANPDVWREGGRNSTMYGKSGGRAVGENMLLKHKSKREGVNPYGSKCKICKCSVHQNGLYCSECAYKNGFCAMCGKTMVDTSSHLMSTA
mmetsp:Transcript_67037/g.169264  ORF Transcript_67037/g.169264 Transcript_67037/m.169264 type:complete len:102 (+) Transcript_67037:92-397(+)